MKVRYLIVANLSYSTESEHFLDAESCPSSFKTMTTVRCLAHFLTTKERKKGKSKDATVSKDAVGSDILGTDKGIPYILKESPVSE